MPNKNFQTFLDCGFSKIRAGTFNTDNNNDAFYVESKFFTDRSDLELKLKKLSPLSKKILMNLLIP